ncbi:hypothetical protein ACFPFV_08085 [Salinicoccus siamensis]|uniref:PRTase associated wHTH domain-containing protein n=1 Tax=Salinicoccus siamensis TaxID=381830 RepID=A0ABV5Z247_9STAP
MEEKNKIEYKKDIVLLYFKEMGGIGEKYEIRSILGFEKEQINKFLEIMIEENLLDESYNLTNKSKMYLNEKYNDKIDFIQKESYNETIIPNDSPLGISEIYIPDNFHA